MAHVTVRIVAAVCSALALSACGGMVLGEDSLDAAADADASMAPDARSDLDSGVARLDAQADRSSADANDEDAREAICPSGEATCDAIAQCIAYLFVGTLNDEGGLVPAPPVPGVTAFHRLSDVVDFMRRLDAPPDSGYGDDYGEFVADGHPYAWFYDPTVNEWFFVQGDAAPDVYRVVLEYIRCEEPQDAASG